MQYDKVPSTTYVKVMLSFSNLLQIYIPESLFSKLLIINIPNLNMVIFESLLLLMLSTVFNEASPRFRKNQFAV